jgi:2-oxoglutarate ferredoxin oxidoreductase subunit alpha
MNSTGEKDRMSPIPMEPRPDAVEATTAPASGEAKDTSPVTIDSCVLALVGRGGDGVVLLGDLLLQMAAEQGIFGVMVQSYGPQIRGGESAAVVRLSRTEIQYEGEDTDLLVCFRMADIERFNRSVHLHPNSMVILEESDQGDLPPSLEVLERPVYRYPFSRFEDGLEVAGEPKNMKALALVTKLLGWDPEFGRGTLRKRFGHRPELLAKDLAAYDSAINASGLPSCPKLHATGLKLHVETGNEAIARGAMDSGLSFFAGYPITPSSEVMETLIDEFPARGGRVVQAEDEIAALGMVIGASFGGSMAMTATSGPGLSLMTEMMGLSSMAEMPAVIVDCQRAGPATGMPSRTEQSDLYHAVYGGHGDFPRAVLGVLDVVHARDVMQKAFQISENYQLPVIVLSDAYIAQRRQIRELLQRQTERHYRKKWTPDEGPARFNLTGTGGVNAFRIPGTPGGEYLTSGIEHTPEGTPSADTDMHQQMNAKRFRKLEGIAADTRNWYRSFGPPDATRGIIAWGSHYGLLREWVATRDDYRVFMPVALHPFPIEAFETWEKGLRSAVTIELSYQAQFYKYLSSLTDTRKIKPIARSGGWPLKMRELNRLLEEQS